MVQRELWQIESYTFLKSTKQCKGDGGTSLPFPLKHKERKSDRHIYDSEGIQTGSSIKLALPWAWNTLVWPYWEYSEGQFPGSWYDYSSCVVVPFLCSGTKSWLFQSAGTDSSLQMNLKHVLGNGWILPLQVGAFLERLYQDLVPYPS